jgi:hypothetical protein
MRAKSGQKWPIFDPKYILFAFSDHPQQDMSLFLNTRGATFPSFPIQRAALSPSRATFLSTCGPTFVVPRNAGPATSCPEIA